MYELVKITENAYYVDCPAKMGLVRISGNEVILIDSGNDKDAGKRALRIINENGMILKSVYNTHSHADHIGGNRLIKERSGCDIYAPRGEMAFVENPLFEPSLLFGANPPASLRHKFLMAEPSVAKPISENSLPDGIGLISLPGHSPDMTGFITSEGVAYIGDALSSVETLDKYGIGYLWDVGEYLKSLDRLKEIDAEIFVPSHAPVCKNITELADYNLKSTLGVADRICEFISEPSCFDSLLCRVFSEFGLSMNFVQHALIGSTVRAYLTYLTENGRAEAFVENNTLLWRRI